MRYLILITILLLAGIFMCIRQDRVDINNIEAIKVCSRVITEIDIFKKDNSLIFKAIYGEYDFSDSTRILINPNGRYFYMKELPNNKIEILMSGKMEANIVDGLLYLSSEFRTQLYGQALVCQEIIIDVETNKTGTLLCKCTL